MSASKLGATLPRRRGSGLWDILNVIVCEVVEERRSGLCRGQQKESSEVGWKLRVINIWRDPHATATRTRIICLCIKSPTLVIVSLSSSSSFSDLQTILCWKLCRPPTRHILTWSTQSALPFITLQPRSEMLHLRPPPQSARERTRRSYLLFAEWLEAGGF